MTLSVNRSSNPVPFKSAVFNLKQLKTFKVGDKAMVASGQAQKFMKDPYNPYPLMRPILGLFRTKFEPAMIENTFEITRHERRKVLKFVNLPNHLLDYYARYRKLEEHVKLALKGLLNLQLTYVKEGKKDTASKLEVIYSTYRKLALPVRRSIDRRLVKIKDKNKQNQRSDKSVDSIVQDQKFKKQLEIVMENKRILDSRFNTSLLVKARDNEHVSKKVDEQLWSHKPRLQRTVSTSFIEKIIGNKKPVLFNDPELKEAVESKIRQRRMSMIAKRM